VFRYIFLTIGDTFLLVVVLIIGYLVCRSKRRSADQKNIMDYEKEDYDIRENIVDYDEDGAGKGR
jgi:hypothetical protein